MTFEFSLVGETKSRSPILVIWCEEKSRHPFDIARSSAQNVLGENVKLHLKDWQKKDIENALVENTEAEWLLHVYNDAEKAFGTRIWADLSSTFMLATAGEIQAAGIGSNVEKRERAAHLAFALAAALKPHSFKSRKELASSIEAKIVEWREEQDKPAKVKAKTKCEKTAKAKEVFVKPAAKSGSDTSDQKFLASSPERPRPSQLKYRMRLQLQKSRADTEEEVEDVAKKRKQRRRSPIRVSNDTQNSLSQSSSALPRTSDVLDKPPAKKARAQAVKDETPNDSKWFDEKVKSEGSKWHDEDSKFDDSTWSHKKVKSDNSKWHDEQSKFDESTWVDQKVKSEDSTWHHEESKFDDSKWVDHKVKSEDSKWHDEEPKAGESTWFDEKVKSENSKWQSEASKSHDWHDDQTWGNILDGIEEKDEAADTGFGFVKESGAEDDEKVKSENSQWYDEESKSDSSTWYGRGKWTRESKMGSWISTNEEEDREPSSAPASQAEESWHKEKWVEGDSQFVSETEASWHQKKWDWHDWSQHDGPQHECRHNDWRHGSSQSAWEHESFQNDRWNYQDDVWDSEEAWGSKISFDVEQRSPWGDNDQGKSSEDPQPGPPAHPVSEEGSRGPSPKRRRQEHSQQHLASVQQGSPAMSPKPSLAEIICSIPGPYDTCENPGVRSPPSSSNGPDDSSGPQEQTPRREVPKTLRVVRKADCRTPVKVEQSLDDEEFCVGVHPAVASEALSSSSFYKQNRKRKKAVEDREHKAQECELQKRQGEVAPDDKLLETWKPLEELGKAVVSLFEGVSKQWEQGYWCNGCKKHWPLEKWKPLRRQEAKFECRKCGGWFDDRRLSELIQTCLACLTCDKCADVLDDQHELLQRLEHAQVCSRTPDSLIEIRVWLERYLQVSDERVPLRDLRYTHDKISRTFSSGPAQQPLHQPPRDSDPWLCGFCGFSNRPSNSICGVVRCKAPRPKHGEWLHRKRHTVDDTIAQLYHGELSVDTPPGSKIFELIVMRYKGKYFSLNNRRLYCLKEACDQSTQVPVKIYPCVPSMYKAKFGNSAPQDVFYKLIRSYSTKNLGTSVAFRAS